MTITSQIDYNTICKRFLPRSLFYYNIFLAQHPAQLLEHSGLRIAPCAVALAGIRRHQDHLRQPREQVQNRPGLAEIAAVQLVHPQIEPLVRRKL